MEGEVMEGELESLENEAIELQKKINESGDFFFIYGWSRRLEEVKKRIEELKDVT